MDSFRNYTKTKTKLNQFHITFGKNVHFAEVNMNKILYVQKKMRKVLLLEKVT